MTKVISTLEGFNRNIRFYLKQISADPLIGLKKYDDAYTLLGPGINKHGLPVTGLTEDFTPERVKGKVQPKQHGTRRAMERLLDMEEGSLKNTSKFWHSFNVKIGSAIETLDLSDDRDLLHYLFLIAQSNVAIGLKNVYEDSRAEFVVYSEEQEAEIRIKGRRALKTAYNLAEELDLETKVNILAVYGIQAGSASANTVIDKIDEKIEENPELFLERAKDGFLVTRSLISKALDAGVLTMDNGAIYHGEVVVGYDRTTAAEALAKNITLQKILKSKISGDMEIIAEALRGEEK